MIGSLRALWPWQGPERELLASTDQVGIALLLFFGGAVFVGILLILERKFGSTEEQRDLLKS
jgi:putative membrane protein